MYATENEIQQVMFDTGMERLQATNHVAQRKFLQRKLALERREMSQLLLEEVVLPKEE